MVKFLSARVSYPGFLPHTNSAFTKSAGHPQPGRRFVHVFRLYAFRPSRPSLLGDGMGSGFSLVGMLPGQLDSPRRASAFFSVRRIPSVGALIMT